MKPGFWLGVCEWRGSSWDVGQGANTSSSCMPLWAPPSAFGKWPSTPGLSKASQPCYKTITERDSDKHNNHNTQSEQVRIVHFGELIRGAAGDLGHSKQSEFRLQVLQLVQQLHLVLVPQLVHLYPRFNAEKEITQIRREKRERIWIFATMNFFVLPIS